MKYLLHLHPHMVCDRRAFVHGMYCILPQNIQNWFLGAPSTPFLLSLVYFTTLCAFARLAPLLFTLCNPQRIPSAAVACLFDMISPMISQFVAGYFHSPLAICPLCKAGRTMTLCILYPSSHRQALLHPIILWTLLFSGMLLHASQTVPTCSASHGIHCSSTDRDLLLYIHRLWDRGKATKLLSPSPSILSDMPAILKHQDIWNFFPTSQEESRT